MTQQPASMSLFSPPVLGMLGSPQKADQVPLRLELGDTSINAQMGWGQEQGRGLGHTLVQSQLC